VVTTPTAVLSQAQLASLAEHGVERRAAVGDVLFRVGDRRYPLIAIIEGEAVILDASGAEVIRHGPSGFLGETNLLTGQTVYLTAVVTEPMRYIAVEREQLRALLFEDGSLSDLLLSTFITRREALQARDGVGIEIMGPQSSEATRRLVDFARRSRLPSTWVDTGHLENVEARALIEAIPDDELPLVRLPGGPDLRNPSPGELSRALGIGLDLGPTEEVDLLVVGAGPAGLGAAVYGASEGLETLVVEGSALGGQAGTSRRIENYLGFPAGISGTELTARAVTQARKFGARTATPYRAVALEPGVERHLVQLEGGHEVAARAVVLATGADYRRLPVPDAESYEGVSIFYAAGPQEAQRCGATRVGVVGGGNSAAQAAIWLARGGALVTLLHRRADLSETMSDYLIHDLERAGVISRGRSEIAALHGRDGELEGATLRDGERIALSFLFLFLGASPCTDWLGNTLALDDDGFVLTGQPAGADSILETSVTGVYAVGDVRAGSIKRCATAVGEGAMVVRFIHERLSRDTADASTQFVARASVTSVTSSRPSEAPGSPSS
jgi:thioredoxin reductase (NADPH)